MKHKCVISFFGCICAVSVFCLLFPPAVLAWRTAASLTTGRSQQKLMKLIPLRL